MKKTFAATFLVLLSLTLYCSPINAQEKVMKLNLQAFHGPTHWTIPMIQEWAAEIDQGTGGTVKITRYDMGMLSPQAQTYDSVVRGIVDIGETVLAYTPGRFPLMEFADVPIGGKSANVMGHLLNEVYKKYKPKEFDDVKVLYLHSNFPYVLHAKKPIHNLADLQGLKVRTSGGTAELLKLLGATPVAMSMGEAYDALSRGVVDANWTSDETLRVFRFADVTKFSIRCSKVANITVFVVAMNKEKWNALSPKQQKVIEVATAKLREKHLAEWDKQEEQIREWARKEKGVQFIIISGDEEKRWAERVQPLAKEYIEKTKKLGLPGEDVMKFAHDYLEKHQ